MKDKIFRAEPSPLGGHAQGAGARPTGAGGRGGRPAWAGGAIPETVELGRLNVARAPDQVLDRALNEAYASKLDKNGDGALDVDADLHAIESPLAALGLYREAMVGIRMVGGAWSLQDAALFLGKAADKNIRITPDTVQALGILLEVERDLSNFSYDRSAVYPAAIGTVFGGLGFSGTGATAFAQAADDARAIVQFEHDHGH